MWTPLFDALRGKLSPWSEVYLGVYAQETFGADFTIYASAPDPLPHVRVFDKLLAVAAPLFSYQRDQAFVVIERPASDVLVAADSEWLDGKTAVVLALRSAHGDLQAAVVVVTSDERRLALLAADLAAITGRFAGTLGAAIALRSTREERQAVSRIGLSDSAAFVSALVPDANNETAPFLPACALMEGRAELESGVVFDRITGAVSPRMLEEIASREVSLWSLGKPSALCGLGSAGDPRFPLGRLAASNDVALFGLTKRLTPAESDDYSPSIARLAAVLQSPQRPLEDSPFQRAVARSSACDVARAELTADALAALTSLDLGPRPPDPLHDRDDVSLWCVAESRAVAVIAEWQRDGEGLVPAFKPVDQGDDISAAANDSWLRAAYFEFSDPRRWTAWARIFASLVECSHAAEERDRVYRIDSGCVHNIDAYSGTRAENATVHGPLLTDGTEIVLHWQDHSCCVEIRNGARAIQSVWKVIDRYVPLCVHCPPSGVVTRTLDGREFRYPPACSHLLATANRASRNARWIPEDPGVSSSHIRLVTDSISPLAEFWFDAINMLIAVPVGRDRSGPELLLDEWSTGTGARWLLLVPFALASGAPTRSWADRLLEILRPIQDRIVTEIQGDSRDLDRILVEHLRHDLAVMRTAFNVLSLRATESVMSAEGAHDGLTIQRSIRDLDDKLDGLETLCHLRDQSESPLPLDLELLEGSLALAIMRAASRARKKLALAHSEEERLASSISYDPPPPTKPLPRPNPLAVLLLENILGNALYAAEMAFTAVDRRNTVGGEAVRVSRRDETIIITNECRPADWEFARRELQTTSPKTRGLSVIVHAGRIGGVRIVPGVTTSGAAELHLIPERSAL